MSCSPSHCLPPPVPEWEMLGLDLAHSLCQASRSDGSSCKAASLPCKWEGVGGEARGKVLRECIINWWTIINRERTPIIVLGNLVLQQQINTYKARHDLAMENVSMELTEQRILPPWGSVCAALGKKCPPHPTASTCLFQTFRRAEPLQTARSVVLIKLTRQSLMQCG